MQTKETETVLPPVPYEVITPHQMANHLDRLSPGEIVEWIDLAERMAFEFLASKGVEKSEAVRMRKELVSSEINAIDRELEKIGGPNESGGGGPVPLPSPPKAPAPKKR